MSLGPRLDIRQTQSLVMTPQLQQAIRLLALSNLEVESFIAEELERNPLLEASGEDTPAPDDSDDSGAAVEREEPETVDELVAAGGGLSDAPLDIDHNDENLHQDSASDSMAGLDGSLGMQSLG